ncbi:MAG: HAD-IA family hydrolase, partial [Jatrophihabitantaceae bacterium]
AITDQQWRAAIADELAERYGPAGRRSVRDWSRSAGEVAAEVLALVRQQRLVRPVALLSNATDRLPADLARLGLDRELDAVFSSWQLGLAKPDPAVFIAVSARLGSAAGDCLLVDDAAENVRAAIEVGMLGHHFRTVAGLVAFLATQP